MWDNLPIDADRRMAVCSVEWTAVVNGGKFKFKPIESCLCLVLNIQFTSQQPLVSGEMKLLPLQHFSISPESWLLSSHRSLSLQIWRLEICYWFCNSIFSSNIWHGFWQKAAMISWLKYIDQLQQHRHTDELWIPIKRPYSDWCCGSPSVTNQVVEHISMTGARCHNFLFWVLMSRLTEWHADTM